MQQIIVEYSASQDAFHRCTFQERLQNQRICRQRGFKSDYEPIATFSSYEEADQFIRRCRQEKAKAA